MFRPFNYTLTQCSFTSPNYLTYWHLRVNLPHVFYDLPRFSTDFNFKILDSGQERKVFEKVKDILLQYGKTDDAHIKFLGSIIVLDYGAGKRKLKVEISNREYGNHYEKKNLNGLEITVMEKPDMFPINRFCRLVLLIR